MVDSQQTVLAASKIKTDDEVDLIETAIERGVAAPTVRERAGHRVPPERPAARGGQPERPFGSSAVSRSRDRTRRRRRRRSVATRTAGRQCRDGPNSRQSWSRTGNPPGPSAGAIPNGVAARSGSRKETGLSEVRSEPGFADTRPLLTKRPRRIRAQRRSPPGPGRPSTSPTGKRPRLQTAIPA